MSPQLSTATSSTPALETSSETKTSDDWLAKLRNDPVLTRQLAKQSKLAEWEYQHLSALPSLANSSDATRRALSQSFMIGATEQELDEKLLQLGLAL